MQTGSPSDEELEYAFFPDEALENALESVTVLSYESLLKVANRLQIEHFPAPKLQKALAEKIRSLEAEELKATDAFLDELEESELIQAGWTPFDAPEPAQ